MELVVDKFGRVVLPKPVREDLGLSAGDIIQVDQRPGCLILWPMPQRNVLKRKDGFLVFSGVCKEEGGANQPSRHGAADMETKR